MLVNAGNMLRGWKDELDPEEEEEGVDRVVVLGNSHPESLSCSFVNSITRLRSSIEGSDKDQELWSPTD